MHLFSPSEGLFVLLLWAGGLLVQSAYLLTCATIHLSSIIWFDCFPPASVFANSPQCDFVVWHKVMKTYKALITCQWLWSKVLVDLRSRSHTWEEEKNKKRWRVCSHILYHHMHTAANTHTRGCTVLQLKLPSCHQPQIDGSFSHGFYDKLLLDVLIFLWPC